MYTSYANRGMAFEQAINSTNDQYQLRGIAFIEKKPTPIRVLKTFKNGHLSGFFEKKSSVDYSGVCHGRSIYFEAKNTNNRTRFSLDNIPDHQAEVLNFVHDLGAIAFFLVNFDKHKEVYLLTIEQATEWLEKAKEGGRKSIPYEWFVTNCDLVKSHHEFALHYLDCLDLLD